MKKFAKRFGIFILFVLVVYLVLCMFGPKENGISRTISINASPEVVNSTMGDYKFFVEKWSPWTEKDPKAKITYTGDPKTVGHKYTWDGNDSVGSGSMTIDSISANRVVTALEFLKPFKSSNKMWLDVQPDGTGSKVEWKMRGDVPFMMRGMMMFMNFEKMMAPDFDKGAKKMKEAIEAMATTSSTADYKVTESEWPAKTYFGKRASLDMSEMGAFFGKNFPAISADLKKNKIEAAGAPSEITWTWYGANGKSDMAAVLPVPAGSKAIKGWEKFDFPACKVFSIDYYGPYEKIESGHLAMEKYMKEKGAAMNVAIEEYLTDPMNEPDTAKWLTKIHYLLK